MSREVVIAHLCRGSLGDTIGHFTMTRFARSLSLFALAAALLQPLTLAARQQIEAVYGPLPVFELHSGFWINLHHLLYDEARQQHSAVPATNTKPAKSAKPILQIAPGAKVAFNASEQRAWDEAVAYYAANYADKDLLFSTELVLLKNQLGDFETCGELSGTQTKSCAAGLPGKLTQILASAAPRPVGRVDLLAHGGGDPAAHGHARRGIRRLCRAEWREAGRVKQQ